MAYTDVAPDEHNQQWVSSSEWARAWLFSYFDAIATTTAQAASARSSADEHDHYVCLLAKI